MNYNLLVSYQQSFSGAKNELKALFEKLGDPSALIEKTIARGIAGIKTKLDSREVINKIRELYHQNPLQFNFTLKYVPSDHWCKAELKKMKKLIIKLKTSILKGETWKIELEKRRYTKMHSIDIIKELAPLIGEKVNLTSPDKIIRIDIIDGEASISLLKPKEIFSVSKPD